MTVRKLFEVFMGDCYELFIDCGEHREHFFDIDEALAKWGDYEVTGFYSDHDCDYDNDWYMSITVKDITVKDKEMTVRKLFEVFKGDCNKLFIDCGGHKEHFFDIDEALAKWGDYEVTGFYSDYDCDCEDGWYMSITVKEK